MAILYQILNYANVTPKVVGNVIRSALSNATVYSSSYQHFQHYNSCENSEEVEFKKITAVGKTNNGKVIQRSLFFFSSAVFNVKLFCCYN